MNVPLVLVCLWLIARAVPECPGDRSHRIDVPGAVLCALGLAGPVYALIQQPALGWSDPTVWVPLVGGLGALRRVRRLRAPRAGPDAAAVDLPLAQLRRRQRRDVRRLRGPRRGDVLHRAVPAAGRGLQRRFEAGLSLLPITLLLVTLARRFGALSARVGPRLPMTVGPLVCGAGLLAFARLDERADYLTAGAAGVAAVRPRARDHGRAADGDRPARRPTAATPASRPASTTRSRASPGCWRSRPSAPSCRRSSRAAIDERLPAARLRPGGARVRRRGARAPADGARRRRGGRACARRCATPDVEAFRSRHDRVRRCS